MTIPSFSVVIETANLSLAELDGLKGTLESLQAQTLPIACARQVLICDSGDVPEPELQAMLAAYPWATAIRLPTRTGYEELKIAGVKQSTADVVVFADGDCYYEPTWLELLLKPFADPPVSIVGGETNIDASTAYGLAMAIVFSFPGRGDTADLHQANRYHLNNVAFRRSVLLQHPIPTRRPCYRMSGLHAAALLRAGHVIWREPKARARHAAPNGFEHYVWRFLLQGHDGVAVPKLIAAEASGAPQTSGPNITAGFLARRWVKESTRKLTRELRRKPSRLISLPVVLPIVAGAVFLQALGAVGGMVASRRLLESVPDDILRSSTCQPG
jgi:glycosyltransferase involved in cell wall biosynthesis